jgi:NAD-dependent SIR2 family protein deacetylase
VVGEDDGVQYEGLYNLDGIYIECVIIAIATELRPSYPHEMLALLVQKSLIKFVISQNCDGLHMLSGVPRQQLSELHGNS